MSPFVLILLGVGVGLAAAFTGLGGGFVVVPLLVLSGWKHERAVGTSFVAILVIGISALAAHSRLQNVDWKTGLLLGAGGVVGAQLGARLVEHVSTTTFQRIFALVLVGLAARMFFQK